MKHPTTTLTVAAPSVTLDLAAGYIGLETEDGNPILAEDGDPLWLESFAAPVVLTLAAPSVTLVLRRNA